MKDEEMTTALPRPLRITEEKKIGLPRVPVTYRGDFGYALPGGGKVRIRNLDMIPFANRAPTLRQFAEWVLSLPVPNPEPKPEPPAKHGAEDGNAGIDNPE